MNFTIFKLTIVHTTVMHNNSASSIDFTFRVVPFIVVLRRNKLNSSSIWPAFVINLTLVSTTITVVFERECSLNMIRGRWWFKAERIMFLVLVSDDLGRHWQKLSAEFDVRPEEDWLFLFFFGFFWQNSNYFFESSLIKLLNHWCIRLLLFLSRDKRVLGCKFGCLVCLELFWFFYLIGVVSSSWVVISCTFVLWFLLSLLLFNFGGNLGRCFYIESLNNVGCSCAANFLAHILNKILAISILLKLVPLNVLFSRFRA